MNSKATSNEGQTGITYYTVQPGFSVTARGKTHGEGERVALNPIDGARLSEQGRVKAASEGRAAPSLASHIEGNAPEVIAKLEQDGIGAEDLAELASLERAGRGRKTVLEAIEAAQARAQGGEQ